LLELMGSRLELESAPGAGSRFHFPLQLPVAESEGSIPTRPTGYLGPRRQVLVIDDVAVNRTLLRQLLEPLGFRVREAATGEAGLAAAAAETPDLVLLDLRLPGLNGFEVAQRLRRLPAGAGCKILALSSHALSVEPQEMLAAGCDDFLPKPFRESDLLQHLATLLGLTWQEAAPPAPPPRPAGNATVPAAVLRELLSYARDGQIVPLRTRVAELAQRHADPLLGEIAPLVTGFQLARLVRLLEAALTAHPEA
jgi:CheY-like chemotaxis protein